MRKGMRRLEIWLPDNHWLWTLPPGQRAARVREALDAEGRLAKIEERLRNIEQTLQPGRVLPAAKQEMPNAEEFLSAFTL